MESGPQTSMLKDTFRYGDTEHAHYQEHGYYIFDEFLTDEALSAIQSHVDRLIANLTPGMTAETIMNPHMEGEEWFWKLANEPKLLDMVERQIGPDIVLWSASVLAKPPRTGRPIRWHQDAPYWNISGPFAGGIWIALDNVDRENGTMEILPGWHTRGTFPKIIHEDAFFNEEIDPSIFPKNLDERKISYDLKAGQLGVHDTMLPHFSTPNESDRWRRVISFRYISAGSTVAKQTYESYVDGRKYQRGYFLVRGEDTEGRGFATTPPLPPAP
jgi:phytanoyl-CoA hydroxylase